MFMMHNKKTSLVSWDEKTNSIIINEEGLRQQVNIDDLPGVISRRADSLVSLSRKKDEALSQAISASQSAENASKINLKWYKSDRPAIEALQDATVKQSMAIDSIAEALETVFDSQQKIADVSDFLLSLGLVNTALSQTVIRQIELKLQKASKEKISELARQELLSVINQLKAQELMQNKLEKHSKLLEQQEDDLKKTDEKVKTLEKEQSQTKKELLECIESEIHSINEFKTQFEKQFEAAFRNNEAKLDKDIERLHSLLESTQLNLENKANALSEELIRLSRESQTLQETKQNKFQQVLQSKIDEHIKRQNVEIEKIKTSFFNSKIYHIIILTLLMASIILSVYNLVM